MLSKCHGKLLSLFAQQVNLVLLIPMGEVEIVNLLGCRWVHFIPDSFCFVWTDSPGRANSFGEESNQTLLLLLHCCSTSGGSKLLCLLLTVHLGLVVLLLDFWCRAFPRHLCHHVMKNAFAISNRHSQITLVQAQFSFHNRPLGNHGWLQLPDGSQSFFQSRAAQGPIGSSVLLATGPTRSVDSGLDQPLAGLRLRFGPPLIVFVRTGKRIHCCQLRNQPFQCGFAQKILESSLLLLPGIIFSLLCAQLLHALFEEALAQSDGNINKILIKHKFGHLV
mmetsp:Transcript_14023/g.31064  ORF Transcript_14023/g.31064 Transcript_14023/m.31064 type:complete len:278 (-) Transcript_14023:397-1230(-)